MTFRSRDRTQAFTECKFDLPSEFYERLVVASTGRSLSASNPPVSTGGGFAYKTGIKVGWGDGTYGMYRMTSSVEWTTTPVVSRPGERSRRRN